MDTQHTHRITLDADELGALLLDDDATERADTLAELQRQDDTRHENAMWAARDLAEWHLLQRWRDEQDAADLADA